VDLSPGYLPEEREAPGEGLWAFEINGLIRFLQGQLAGLPPDVEITQFRLRGGPAVQTTVAFVERLMRAWEGGGERNQQRLAAGHQLDTVIGLHDLHFVLAGDQDFDTFLRKTRGVAISLHESDRVAAWASQNNSGPVRVKRLNGKVLDQSLGGYRLVWEKLDNARVKVGELVGLATPVEDGETQDWMVGAIRWLRIEANGAMDAGIELLARLRLDRGAVGLGIEGRQVEAERQDAHRHRAEKDVEQHGHAIEEPDDLDDGRRAAEELDEQHDRQADRRPAAHDEQRQREAERQPDGIGRDGELDRDQEAVPEGPEIAEDGCEVETVGHGPPLNAGCGTPAR